MGRIRCNSNRTQGRNHDVAQKSVDQDTITQVLARCEAQLAE